ncbi:MAG: hypothetical protein HDR02_18845 [Lachnospiraceae bacterium]|nr:hypothetical protein [Lachnospiraceae bacterium]
MSHYDLKEHKNEIITHIIKNLIWFPIAAIIPLGTKLINILYDSISKDSNIITLSNILILLCILLSLTSIIIGIISIKKSKKRNETADDLNNNSNISTDFRFSSVIAELTFDDNRKNLTSTIDYKMIVLTDSAKELKRDLIWSGATYNGTKIVHMNGEYELIDSDRKQSPYCYSIIFNSEKKRGDLIEFKTETSVIDDNLDMMPMYSFMVKYQIDKLIIRVIAPKGMIKNVTKAIYADRGKNICIKEPENVNADTIRNLVRYTYEIKSPTILHNYFIEWEFTK